MTPRQVQAARNIARMIDELERTDDRQEEIVKAIKDYSMIVNEPVAYKQYIVTPGKGLEFK
jgi:hypothetical protein